MEDLFAKFEKGSLTVGGQTVAFASLPWNEHKEFPGVFLKHVLTASQTDGLFTCCLVRIAPNKKIGMHRHADSTELHEVAAGSGVCLTEQGTVPYEPGSMAVLPCNSPHEVRAGQNGLCLFAKFVIVPKPF